MSDPSEGPRGDARLLTEELRRAWSETRRRGARVLRALEPGFKIVLRVIIIGLLVAGRALRALWLGIERAWLAAEHVVGIAVRWLVRGGREAVTWTSEQGAPRAAVGLRRTWAAIAAAGSRIDDAAERAWQRLRPGERDREPLSWSRRLAIAGTAVVALSAVGGLVGFGYLYARTELPSEFAARPTVVVDVHGREIGTLRAEAYEPVEAEQLPDHVKQAVMAAEDRSYLDHPGISVTGTIRALWANFTAGRVEQGGSTITQQYVGELVIEEDPSYRDKVDEALIALKLERETDKAEILERYLNTVYLGRGAYGIGAAARTYFGKPAAELTVNEAAMLAGMIASPAALDPAERPRETDARRTYTLQGMASEGWIPREEAERLIAAGLPETRQGRAIAHETGAYYLEAVREQVAAELGEEAVLTGHRVVVEMDLEAQRTAEAIIRESTQDEPFSGALVAIDPRDGGIRALVGGPDFYDQELNVAIESRRQPGSAFKPFTLAAFVEAGYSPSSQFDAPREIDVDTATGEHTVGNYGGASYGIQSVEEATWTSTNTVYAQLVEEVGPDAVVDIAQRAGIRSELPAVPSITLGTGGVTPLELASAYATFANDGVRNAPRIIRTVERYDGEVVFDGGPDRERVLDEQIARVVTEVLTGVVEGGTGTAADLDRPVAGKTGTTNEYRDAWFAGYVPQLATAVWLGNLDNSPTPDITGGSLPASLWHDFMQQVLYGVPIEDFPDADLSGLDVLIDARPAPPPEPEDDDDEEEKKKQQREEKEKKEDQQDEGDGEHGGGNGDEGRGNGNGGD